jgi:hypothetical protein
MNVYVVMAYNKANYPNENSIQSIHLTRDLADKAVLKWEESQAKYSRKNEYWVEGFELDVGDLTVLQESNFVIIS